MTIKKILLACAGGLLAAAAIAAVVMYMKLGSIVKITVETLGPQMTQTEVRLKSVSLSPFSESGRIRGLFIGNPAGFKTPSAFQLHSVRMFVDINSLRADRVVVREIVVDGPEVTLEGSLSGSNLSRIQENVESFGLALPKVEIGIFKVTNGKLNLSLTALGGKSLSVPLPDIELRDIGRKSGGATAGEAAKEMFGAVTGAALKAAAGMVKGLFGKKK